MNDYSIGGECNMLQSQRAGVATSADNSRLRSDDDDDRLVARTAIVERVRARIFKIVVIGDSNVGKTCLTFRFCGGKFPAATEATIGVDFRERMVEVDEELVKLQLWDTAGQERYHKGLTNHFYRNLHAVIFVYDVTKLSSFDNLRKWLAEYDRHRPDGTADLPRILVGNKCDVEDISGDRVSIQVAQRFADAHGMPLFETSAKDDSEANHVDAIFMTLAHKLRHSRPMMWSSVVRPDAPVGRRSYSGIITVHKGSEQRFGDSSTSRFSGCC